TVGFSSCNTLDLKPEDNYGADTFWDNEAQVSGYVTGMHVQLRDLNFNYFLMGEARGGLQKTGTSSTATSLDYSSPIKDQYFTKDKPGLFSWGQTSSNPNPRNGFYWNILNVNLGIDKIENECAFLSDGA